MKKDIEELFKGDYFRVESYLDSLGVPGEASADNLVGRIWLTATRITGSDRSDALKTLENGFEAPETPAGESGSFERLSHIGILPYCDDYF